MLEMRTYSIHGTQEWTDFGTIHELFIDSTGRIITFTANEMTGSGYQHLILTNTRAVFHQLIMSYHATWEQWSAHHWEEWEHTPHGHTMAASWRDYNPTIFGTDIALTPLGPIYSHRT